MAGNTAFDNKSFDYSKLILKKDYIYQFKYSQLSNLILNIYNLQFSGRITDKQGKIVSDAKVLINKDFDNTTSDLIRLVSDRSGNFTTKLQKNTSYTITVEARGYQSGFATIKTAEVNIERSFQLEVQTRTQQTEAVSDIQVFAVVYKKSGYCSESVAKFRASIRE
ncbi:MAG: carboxypeptidase regulatory-like domain-containing protein [Saprospiraceae bacterium]|nr:carboxypeptidase regulatory-like domain-containing protein [Saprospiraceae bacterium]